MSDRSISQRTSRLRSILLVRVVGVVGGEVVVDEVVVLLVEVVGG
jgi:hypothetical protein